MHKFFQLSGSIQLVNYKYGMEELSQIWWRSLYFEARNQVAIAFHPTKGFTTKIKPSIYKLTTLNEILHCKRLLLCCDIFWLKVEIWSLLKLKIEGSASIPLSIFQDHIIVNIMGTQQMTVFMVLAIIVLEKIIS
jgi:hypothetical protein